MRRPFHVIENALPGPMMGQVLLAGRHAKPVIAKVGQGDSQRVSEADRITTVRWLDPWANRDLRQHLWSLFDAANRESFGVDCSFGPHELQFTEYLGDVRGHYGWHEDTHWEAAGAHDRKLSMSIQLSDPEDYDGGQFEFEYAHHQHAKDFERFKKRGSALIFPSFMRHRVTPVTRGLRMALVTWCDGPRWR